MAVIELIGIELEARKLIRQARRVERWAARNRGQHLCLYCKLHLCAIPLWALRSAIWTTAIGLVLADLHLYGVI